MRPGETILDLLSEGLIGTDDAITPRLTGAVE
jgi:hypothetical protein